MIMGLFSDFGKQKWTLYEGKYSAIFGDPVEDDFFRLEYRYMNIFRGSREDFFAYINSYTVEINWKPIETSTDFEALKKDAMYYNDIYAEDLFAKAAVLPRKHMFSEYLTSDRPFPIIIHGPERADDFDHSVHTSKWDDWYC